MDHHARRIVMPLRKRKEMDSHCPPPSQTSVSVNVNNYAATTTTREEAAEAAPNRLLAGYMAYEFLTKGTLLGERFDPGAVVPLKPKAKPANYTEVASLLRSENAQIPDVVNPSQLGRWLQMY